ncbi:MAG: hypothetical protein AAGM84_04550 [Pseudomonadota bacterium]
MSFLPKDVQDGLDAARISTLAKASRLSLTAGGRTHAVLRLWKTGFSVALADTPHLRGFVDLYEGEAHLFQCLIVAAEEEGLEMRYEFKRATAIQTGPALDFERPADAPVALIEDHLNP